MPKFKVDWTEYRSTVVEADDYAGAHEKVHDTEEYDHDASLVDMSTTDIVRLPDKHTELAEDRLASKRAIADRDRLGLSNWELTFWDEEENIIKVEIIEDRTEQQASKEAEAEADRFSQSKHYETWTLRMI